MTLAPEVAGFLVFTLALFVVGAVGGMRVASKAGYPGWVALLFLVPVVDLVALLVVAFSKWPVERRLEQATRRSRPYGTGVPTSMPVPAMAGQARQAPSWDRAPRAGRSWDPIRGRA